MPSRPSAETRRSAISSAARADCGAGIAVAQTGDQRLGGAHGLGPGAQHCGQDALDRGIERCVVGVHLVDEADPQGVRRVEQLAREEQRARLRAADAREGERGDRGGHQSEAHLGEAEARVLAREHDVAAAGEPGAAAERRALHAGDHRHGAAVDRGEHGGGRLGVGHVALVREPGRRAHPLEIGARAERAAAPCDDDRAQGVIAREAPRTPRGARAISSASKALRRSGRSSQTRATPPSRSMASPLTCGTRRSAARGWVRVPRRRGRARARAGSRAGRSRRRPTGGQSSSSRRSPPRSAPGWAS